VSVICSEQANRYVRSIESRNPRNDRLCWVPDSISGDHVKLLTGIFIERISCSVLVVCQTCKHLITGATCVTIVNSIVEDRCSTIYYGWLPSYCNALIYLLYWCYQWSIWDFPDHSTASDRGVTRITVKISRNHYGVNALQILQFEWRLHQDLKWYVAYFWEAARDWQIRVVTCLNEYFVLSYWWAMLVGGLPLNLD
jgi:hypothetical protein